jgi:hypothetical protein
MRIELFQPSIEGEARILLLIDGFSGPKKSLEGRTKLAKLDFFLRYSSYFAKAMALRAGSAAYKSLLPEPENIETSMIRYRYGPWDPAYYSILGRLIGKGLIALSEYEKGVGYKSTELGETIAAKIKSEPTWAETGTKIELLKRYLNLSGTRLKNFIYDNFPEITKAEWGASL